MENLTEEQKEYLQELAMYDKSTIPNSFISRVKDLFPEAFGKYTVICELGFRSKEDFENLHKANRNFSMEVIPEPQFSERFSESELLELIGIARRNGSLDSDNLILQDFINLKKR